MFSLDKLKKIKNLKDKITYVNDNLPLLGRGSSRVAYKYDDFKVLKIADEKKGLAQNKEESRFYNIKFKYIANILDYDNSNFFETGPFWLFTEIAKPLTNDDFNDFLDFIGINIDEFYFIFDKYDLYPMFYDDEKSQYDEITDKIEKKFPGLWDEIIEIADKFEIITSDLANISNWGYLERNGETIPVIIDLGFTISVYEEFYKR